MTSLTWKDRSYAYIVASVSYTGSLGPSSRDSSGRVGPLGQPHLPALSAARSVRRRSCSIWWGAGQGKWPVVLRCVNLLLVPPTYVPAAVSVSSPIRQLQQKWLIQRKHPYKRRTIPILGVLAEEWGSEPKAAFRSMLAFTEKNKKSVAAFFPGWIM